MSATLRVSAGAPLLEVRGLRVCFPQATGEAAAVDGLELEVRAGELVALVGESGCGKTLTALALLRLVPPPGRITAGSALLEGEDLLRLDERALRARRGARIAMVFQEPLAALNPVLTIGEQVDEVLRWHRGLSRAAARARTLELLAETGLQARHARAFPHQLSGGERQRAMIAMAIAGEPALLLADEPTTALDVPVQAQILALVDRLRRARTMGVLWITHDLALAASAADRIAVMYAGRVVESGPTRELLTRPRHPYTAALLRALPQRARRGEPLATIPGAVPALGARPSGCAFHPRCILARPHCKTDDPALVWVRSSPDSGAAASSADAASSAGRAGELGACTDAKSAGNEANSAGNEANSAGHADANSVETEAANGAVPRVSSADAGAKRSATEAAAGSESTPRVRVACPFHAEVRV